MKVKKFNPTYLILLTTIIIGVFVRLYKIDNPLADWHSWRQADTASVTRIYLNEGVDLLKPSFHDLSMVQTGLENPQGLRLVEFPIYNLIHFGLVKYIPIFNLEIWGRLISVGSYVVSAFCIYLIARKSSGALTGLIATFFYTFLPYNIYFTRVILPEPLAIAFSLMSIVYLLKFMENSKIHQMIISSILLSTAILVKPFVVFYGFVFAYILYQKYGSQIWKEKFIWLSLLIIFLPFMAWRSWISNFPEGIPHWKWAFNGDHIRFRPAFWRWIFGDRIGSLILGIWGVVIFAFGLVSDKIKNFHLIFMVSVFMFVSVFATANVRHDYYQIYLIPPISMILAIGSKTLFEMKSKYHISKFILLFSVFMMLGWSWYRVREMYKINHPEIIRAGEAVDANTPVDALVVAPYNNDTAFLYQTRRSGWPFLTHSIEELIEKGADIYVSVNLSDADTIDIMNRFEILDKTSEYVVINLNNPMK